MLRDLIMKAIIMKYRNLIIKNYYLSNSFQHVNTTVL
jgi:hypothetical protein